MLSLELGAQPASVYARKVGLKRGDTYNHLTKLVDMGLMIQFERGGVSFFGLTDLNEIKHQVSELRRRADLADKELQAVDEQLESRFTDPDLVKIKFHEGAKGVLNLVERTIINNSAKELRILASVDDFYEIMSLQDDIRHFIPLRLKHKVFLKKLVRRTPEMEKMKKNDKDELREIRFLEDQWTFTAQLLVYDEEIVLFGVSKPIFGILIQSKELAQFFKTVFDMCWMTASKK